MGNIVNWLVLDGTFLSESQKQSVLDMIKANDIPEETILKTDISGVYIAKHKNIYYIGPKFRLIRIVFSGY
jgi:hypothetical protein